jgi:hypothetical protein
MNDECLLQVFHLEDPKLPKLHVHEDDSDYPWNFKLDLTHINVKYGIKTNKVAFYPKHSGTDNYLNVMYGPKGLVSMGS